MLSSSGVQNSRPKIQRTYNEMLEMYLGEGGGLQMSNWLILYPTGLLYEIMYIIIIFNPKAMKFGRIVSGQCVCITMLSNL